MIYRSKDLVEVVFEITAYQHRYTKPEIGRTKKPKAYF